MKKFKLNILPNEFFTTNQHSVLIDILSDNKIDVEYGYIFLGYPQWGDTNTDIFQFLGDEFLVSLKNNQTILIVDYTYEGFSRFECPIIKILENNCAAYNINPNRVFYFSGNLKDESSVINVIPIFTLDNNQAYPHLVSNRRPITLGTAELSKLACEKNLKDKIFLSLSRRNRYHRVLGHLILSNSSIFKYGIISQDTIPNFTLDKSTIEKLGITEETIKRFKSSLPFIADHNQFDKNDPFNVLEELHSQTLFSIVNETLVNDYNNTSLFYSEKILKPIINFQPMIIYGQPGINHLLIELGFKTYHDYFDLSFDYEADPILRYKGILSSISNLVVDLASMSVEEKIAWRFKHQDLLEYNYQVFLDTTHSKKQSAQFAALVKKLN
jgi:hypothetical protein